MLQIALKQYRERAGLSQAALGKQIGVGQSTIGMWESGKNVPDNVNRQKLADLFGISVYQLMNGDKEDPYSVLFRERLAEELQIIDAQEFCNVGEAMADYLKLETLSETVHPLSLFEACDAADKLGKSMSYMLQEVDEDTVSPSLENKKSPDAEKPAPRDSKENEIIQLLEIAQLDDSQKDFLIALLETVTARNRQKRSVVQASVDGTALVSEHHDQT